MKFNLLALACALMLAFGLSMGSFAGSITDADSDGVPDNFDNCTGEANGPLLGGCSAQNDADDDGYGTTCDADFNNDGGVSTTDIGLMVGFIGQASPLHDMNCDGGVSTTDVGIAAQLLGTLPGPSGLACAGDTGNCPPL
jgi:hypothetical protein